MEREFILDKFSLHLISTSKVPIRTSHNLERKLSNRWKGTSPLLICLVLVSPVIIQQFGQLTGNISLFQMKIHFTSVYSIITKLTVQYSLRAEVSLVFGMSLLSTLTTFPFLTPSVKTHCKGHDTGRYSHSSK